VFLDSSPTPLDLNFRLGHYPVRVSVWFWVGMAFCGSFSFNDPLLGPAGMAVWLACGFLSILFHELGHAATARAFGVPARISLIAFGGYAEYTRGAPPSGWRRLLVVLAGPAVNFLIVALLVVSNLSADWAHRHPVLLTGFGYLFLQNLAWGILNLFPVWPMDGGQALREVLYIVGVRRPDPATHATSAVVGGMLALLGLAVLLRVDLPFLDWLPFIPGPLMMVFFGLLAFQNWQLLQQYNQTRAGWDTTDDDERRWRGYR